MPIIKLQSSDGEIFETEVQIAKCSGTIKTMLEDCGMDEEEEAVVPLPNVNSAILRRVLQWANYHKDDPTPTEDDENKEKRTDDISSWDADFLKVDQGKLNHKKKIKYDAIFMFNAFDRLFFLSTNFIFIDCFLKEMPPFVKISIDNLFFLKMFCILWGKKS